MADSFMKDSVSPGSLTLCAFRIYRAVSDIIKDLAEVQKVTPSDWLRQAVQEKLERETGRVIPMMPIHAGKPALNTLLEMAASQEGMSLEDYTKSVLEQGAARSLGLTPPGGTPAVRRTSRPPKCYRPIAKR